MGRRLTLDRLPKLPFIFQTVVQKTLSGISIAFAMLFQVRGQITYVLLTRAPLYSLPEGNFLVRLACVKHAASVHSEPGSNSP